MDTRPSIKRRRYRCIEACYTCKRRKEKCDGNQPCARCIDRNVDSTCEFLHRRSSTISRDGGNHGRETFNIHESAHRGPVIEAVPSQERHHSLASPTNKSSTESTSSPSQLIQGTDVTVLFTGNTTNLSWLHDLHRLVSASVGSCGFVEKLFQIQMPQSATGGPASWLRNVEKYPLAKPTFEEAAYLIRWYESACICGVDLFDESELMNELQSWLGNQAGHVSSLDAIYFLVLAIGAQTCPKDQDTLADSYLDCGRYLTASYLSDGLSIATVQAYTLIAVYLLGAAQNTAAYLSLGMALRSVSALGLHRPDAASAFGARERRAWEKTWKAIRVLDLTVSALLGQPPSTQEIRVEGLGKKYSASNDLFAIFEKILTYTHSKRTITADILQDISQHHRGWAMRFRDGLEADGIQSEEFLEDGAPNIRLLHLKQAYFWTLILLTRPFFVESISSYVAAKANRGVDVITLDSLSHSQEFLVHACINASISIVDLFTVLLESENLPRRLPFIVNSLFVSGLVLGLSCFGDLHTRYTLHENLGKVLTIMELFPDDAVAKRHSNTLQLLLDACNVYTYQ